MKRALLLGALILLMPSAALAGSYDLKEKTPAVEQALANRQGRYAVLANLKAGGVAGEDNQGHVARLGGGPEVATVVSEENHDREAIYAAIVQQNALPAEAIATVRQVFAETQRDKAAAGDKIQLPSGEWVTK